MLLLRAVDTQAYSSEKFAKMVSQGVDAIEFRVDTYVEPGFLTFIPEGILYEASYRIAFLRRHLHLPVIYSLRPRRESGAFTGTLNDYLTLVAHGFRLLCDVVEISMRELNDEQIRSLLAKRQPGTKVLLSAYWPEETFEWDSEKPKEYIERAIALGADVVKLVKPANSMLDNFEAVKLQERFALKYPHLPLIINNFNNIGLLSHCFNIHLAPVTHPNLPSSSSLHRERHLLTAVELERGLVAAGLSQVKQVFDIETRNLGTRFPVDPSALMQTGFDQLALPFEMRFISQAEGKSLEKLMQSPTFGGALVSTSVDSEDSTATLAARTIGKADIVYGSNMPIRITPPTSRKLIKDNKMVLAIRKCIVRHLSPVNAINTHSAAVLEGGAGHQGREALFTLLSLGIKTVYLLHCQPEVHDPPLQLPSDALKVPFRLVQLASFEELPVDSRLHRPVNVVVSLQSPPSACPAPLAHAVGGVMVNLSKHTSGWCGSGDNWIDVSRTAVEAELVKEQFSAITGKTLPSDTLAL